MRRLTPLHTTTPTIYSPDSALGHGSQAIAQPQRRWAQVSPAALPHLQFRRILPVQGQMRLFARLSPRRTRPYQGQGGKGGEFTHVCYLLPLFTSSHRPPTPRPAPSTKIDRGRTRKMSFWTHISGLVFLLSMLRASLTRKAFRLSIKCTTSRTPTEMATLTTRITTPPLHPCGHTSPTFANDATKRPFPAPAASATLIVWIAMLSAMEARKTAACPPFATCRGGLTLAMPSRPLPLPPRALSSRSSLRLNKSSCRLLVTDTLLYFALLMSSCRGRGLHRASTVLAPVFR